MTIFWSIWAKSVSCLKRTKNWSRKWLSTTTTSTWKRVGKWKRSSSLRSLARNASSRRPSDVQWVTALSCLSPSLLYKTKSNRRSHRNLLKTFKYKRKKARKRKIAFSVLLITWLPRSSGARTPTTCLTSGPWALSDSNLWQAICHSTMKALFSSSKTS